jgi:hypothetical protein
VSRGAGHEDPLDDGRDGADSDTSKTEPTREDGNDTRRDAGTSTPSVEANMDAGPVADSGVTAGDPVGELLAPADPSDCTTVGSAAFEVEGLDGIRSARMTALRPLVHTSAPAESVCTASAPTRRTTTRSGGPS